MSAIISAIVFLPVRTGCWCLCWWWWEGIWKCPGRVGGDAGCWSRNVNRGRSAGPRCNLWHAAGSPFCWRVYSAGCSAPAPWVWSSSRSCCRAGWEDRPPGACSVPIPGFAPSYLLRFSGKTALDLLLSCWRCVEKKTISVWFYILTIITRSSGSIRCTVLANALN